MDIQQIVTHHEDLRTAIQMAFALIITGTLMGLTWFTFCRSEASRAERQKFDELEGKYKRLEAWAASQDSKRSWE